MQFLKHVWSTVVWIHRRGTPGYGGRTAPIKENLVKERKAKMSERRRARTDGSQKLWDIPVLNASSKSAETENKKVCWTWVLWEATGNYGSNFSRWVGVNYAKFKNDCKVRRQRQQGKAVLLRSLLWRRERFVWSLQKDVCVEWRAVCFWWKRSGHVHS